MDLKELALKVDIAAFNAKPIKQLSLENSFDLQDAYEVQRLAMEERYMRGEKLIGLKLGFTSYAKMEQMGVHDMIWGRLTDAMLIENRGELNLNKFIHPRAEPEICFRVSKDIHGEIKLEDLDGYIDAMAPAIEIIDSRFEHFKFSLEDVVADNCSSSALVVGDWTKARRDIGDLKMQMYFNDRLEAEGSSKDILGDPWKSVQAATRLAAQYGESIKAGYLIMAGAATAASFIQAGTEVSAVVEGMGEVGFRVAS